MADKLTTSKTISGEEEPTTKRKGKVLSQAEEEEKALAAATVGTPDDWNHTEGEADPRVDPNA